MKNLNLKSLLLTTALFASSSISAILLNVSNGQVSINQPAQAAFSVDCPSVGWAAQNTNSNIYVNCAWGDLPSAIRISQYCYSTDAQNYNSANQVLQRNNRNWRYVKVTFMSNRRVTPTYSWVARRIF